jgi:hypothetical protein
MTYDIQREREYFVVYINGRFYCTADNEKEAAKEAEECLRSGKYAKKQNH